MSKLYSVNSKISSSGQKVILVPVFFGRPDLLELGDRIAPFVGLGPDAIVPLDLEVQPLGKRVDNGHADAVQTSGHLIGLLVELAAGMENGQDDLGRRPVLLLVPPDRDAAAIVDDRDGVVDVYLDVDLGAVSGQGLVDAVVDNFVDQMVQALGAYAADIHGRPLANGLESLQYFDTVGCVLFCAHGPSTLKKIRAFLMGSEWNPVINSGTVDYTKKQPKDKEQTGLFTHIKLFIFNLLQRAGPCLCGGAAVPVRHDARGRVFFLTVSGAGGPGKGAFQRGWRPGPGTARGLTSPDDRE